MKTPREIAEEMYFLGRITALGVNEVEQALIEYGQQERNRALDDAVDAAERSKCKSDSPWDCGCDPGIKAIRALKTPTEKKEG